MGRLGPVTSAWGNLNQKQIASVHAVQNSRRVRPPGYGTAGCGRQLWEDRGLQQKRADKWILGGEHLVGQILNQLAVGLPELVEELPARVGQFQREQRGGEHGKSSGPALGSVVERGEL